MLEKRNVPRHKVNDCFLYPSFCVFVFWGEKVKEMFYSQSEAEPARPGMLERLGDGIALEASCPSLSLPQPTAPIEPGTLRPPEEKFSRAPFGENPEMTQENNAWDLGARRERWDVCSLRSWCHEGGWREASGGRCKARTTCRLGALLGTGRSTSRLASQAMPEFGVSQNLRNSPR